jgi:hypothetical protein
VEVLCSPDLGVALTSRSQATLDLARELVDDIELSRLSHENLLLKAIRLARLVDDKDVQAWLKYELNGYPNTAEALPWARWFGRIQNEKMGMGYWIPLAGISGTIDGNAGTNPNSEGSKHTFCPVKLKSE